MADNTIVTETVHWPVVVHRTLGKPTDAQVDAFITRADEILGRATPHVVVFDNSQAGMPSAYMRKRNTEWLVANQDTLAKHCVGVAFVFPSAALRFVMSAAMLVWSQPVPHDVFAGLPEALAWARQRVPARHLRAG